MLKYDNGSLSQLTCGYNNIKASHTMVISNAELGTASHAPLTIITTLGT
jgi:hypothetical protein